MCLSFYNTVFRAGEITFHRVSLTGAFLTFYKWAEHSIIPALMHKHHPNCNLMGAPATRCQRHPRKFGLTVAELYRGSIMIISGPAA
jgi:hypothetical protein